ncbi:MAG: cytochrome c [Sediminibacterium sp.]|nr:cytochrome c [Sediminibacterium sp.]
MASDKNKIMIAASLVAIFLCYTFYIYASLPIKNFTANEAVSKGKRVWQEKNCGACHQIYGLGGYLGPDLTNEYSLRSTDFIKVFLNYGTPAMPNFNLSEQDINHLLAFLKSIDASGKSDPKTFTIHYNGTIEQ